MPTEGVRRILGFAEVMCSWHEEQCTLAEYCAYTARDVIAHIELTAQARIKDGQRSLDKAADAEDDASADEEPAQRERLVVEDIGQAGDDDFPGDEEEEAAPRLRPLHPLVSAEAALRCASNAGAVEASLEKRWPRDAEQTLLQLYKAYGPLLAGNFGIHAQAMDATAALQASQGLSLKEDACNAIDLQKARIKHAKQQANTGEVQTEEDSGDVNPAEYRSAEEEPVHEVPMSIVMQGPAACAWHLLCEASCTEEQIDAVALLALDMEKKFRALPADADLSRQPLLPLSSESGNHRAAWLGGGAVGKTRTMRLVVEPLAVSYWGPQGYLPTAQSNHAAQELGPRGRTLHAANALLATSSLQTARLRLTPEAMKTLERRRGSAGIEVTDELGTVPADLLHADALRATYCRARKHNFPTTTYMRPQDSWGRVFAKILCGDFLQLPPVPASASLLAELKNKSYEHQQGYAVLASVEYVVDFVMMQRFDDKLLVEILEGMRKPGGQKLSPAAWAALQATQVKTEAEKKSE